MTIKKFSGKTKEEAIAKAEAVEVSAEDITNAHNDSARGDKGFGECTGNK